MAITKATAQAVAPAAKGDLVVGSATNDAAVLGVGTDGQVLTADSATATGLKWAAASSGASLLQTVTSANYYKQKWTGTIGSSSSIDYFQTTYYCPIYLPAGTVDRITFRTGTTYSGTATVRVGLYNDSNGKPSTVLVDAGTVSVTADAAVYSVTLSTSITAGWYWTAFNATDSGGTNTYYAYSGTTNITSFMGFLPSQTSNSPTGVGGNGFYQTGVTGAFATAGTLVENDLDKPQLLVRVS